MRLSSSGVNFMLETLPVFTPLIQPKHWFEDVKLGASKAKQRKYCATCFGGG
jgi:hypothetical protein